MSKPRGREHTTLTETAQLVVRELQKLEGIKMIAPGEIKTGARSKTGKRHLTAVFTTAGMELLISGQSVQKVAVHTTLSPEKVFQELTQQKKLQHIKFKTRDRKPGV